MIAAELNRIRAARAIALARAGDPIQAAAEAERTVNDTANSNTPTLYDAACAYAIASGSVKGDLEQTERYATRAIALLRQTAALGVFLNPRFRNGPDPSIEPGLDALRSREDFHNLCTAIMLAKQAQCDARNGDYQKSAREYLQATELEPSFDYARYQCGGLLAYLGDNEAFRKHCRVLLERKADTQDRNTAERLAKLMSCVPTEVSGVAPERLMELVDRAVAGETPHVSLPYFCLTKGMVEYRAGHFNDAALWLGKVPALEAEFQALRDLYLAMARYRMGDRARSVETLQQAIARFERISKPGSGDLTVSFHDYLFCILARREAEAMILGAVSSATSRPAPARAVEAREDGSCSRRSPSSSPAFGTRRRSPTGTSSALRRTVSRYSRQR